MAGITKSVSPVEAASPEIMAQARGGQRLEEEKAKGKSLATEYYFERNGFDNRPISRYINKCFKN